MIYTFSIVLESVCVLPQLLLLRQTTVPTVIDSFYLLTLGSYRAFYILNWIVRAASKEHYFDPIVVIFGVIQTAFYIDFAWVYWTRQRVKLRSGGVVDSEDFRKGWLVNKVISAGRPSSEIDEESLPAANEHENIPDNNEPRKPTRWGARGISVSADDTLDEHHQQKNKRKETRGRFDGANEEAAAILEEDDDLFSDGEEDARPLAGQNHPVLNSDNEWTKGSTP
jgi:ER lumen protein retaining receptor